ncbi:hypothetical protein [Mucilaginibacter flavidus]|uniref:hypothetical protein n=1 Tax=Mucilaginibacter flavidus TaxID=2949309 RepID=UPI002092EE05|nr:hypothetical protein [Mucilaginibacter flavidus]MCO5947150.1 hypothetical protein [Mucilaginibacter flavidus]
MTKIDIYEIKFSVDKTVTGSADRQILGFTDPENDSPERYSKYQEIYYDFIEGDFEMNKFSGDKVAIPTDMLSSNFLVMNGFFVSQAFVTLLEGFNICGGKYRDVYIKYLSKKKGYKFLNLIMCPNISFEESSFFIEDEINDEKPEEIKLSSVEDFVTSINKLQNEKGYGFTINPKKIVLKKMYDLFKYEISGRFLISEELKSALEKSELSGYVIRPFKLDVFI